MNRLVRAALDCGAAKAVVLSMEQIVLNGEFASICARNECGNYGKCWMCPPDIALVEEMMARVRSFPRGLMYQSISMIEDGFDIEGMSAAAKRHAWLSHRIEQAARPWLADDHLHLSCGGCNLCNRCAKRDGQPCRMPEWALPPMEGAGIDVYSTVKDTPLKYVNGANSVTYFGLLLFHEVRSCPD